MLTKTSAMYNDILKKYWVIYENDDYKVLFQYKADENQEPVEVTDPTETDKLKIEFICKDKIDGLRIILFLNKEGTPYNELNALIFESLGRDIYFDQMQNETGKWALAAKTVLETNELIKELFPGYYITKKSTY